MRENLTSSSYGEGLETGQAALRQFFTRQTFFKWMKQHLKIKHLYGTSEHAVYNRVWIALIAFCLLVLVKSETRVKHSLLQLTRWLTKLFWQPCSQWIMRLKKKPSRTSKGRRRKRTDA